MESRLLQYDMTPEGGCSSAFKASLKSFLDDFVKTLKETYESLVENSVSSEGVAQQLFGVTAKQLKV